MDGDSYDLVIVGAGIIGLATGLRLRERHPGIRMAILEKEDDVALHQTGHNSGVLHAGIYYRPGSLKARLCTEGVQRMITFCDSHNIRYELCGKVVVATDEREMGALEELYRRGTANGVPGLRRISPEELRDLEPHVSSIAALHSPHTGIVDYRQVAQAMAGDLRAQGVDLRTAHRVTAIRSEDRNVRIVTTSAAVSTRYLVNCAGLYADSIARMAGASPTIQIIPFRGEYYYLRPEQRCLVRGLIYPVPDPDLPFLGVHFTRTIDGRVEAGPNAVLAFAREGYTWRTLRVPELMRTVAYPGFWRLAKRWWRTGIAEFRRSFSKELFAASLQQLVPTVRPEDLIPGGAGVRAQAIARNGTLVDDFAIVESPRAVHVLNAPSPGATASLAIGDHICSVAERSFELQQRGN